MWSAKNQSTWKLDHESRLTHRMQYYDVIILANTQKRIIRFLRSAVDMFGFYVFLWNLMQIVQ